ncbi:hypothetical protein D3C87_1376190 [compost metagenome]
MYAIRLPNPVFIKPLAIKKEIPINQITLSPKLPSANEIDLPGSPGARTPVNATRAIAIIDIVPIDAALSIIPNMVAKKIANKCQASDLTPSGTGINQISKPKASVTKIIL